MPKELNQQERQILKKFLNEVIVEEKDIRKVPTSFKEAKFCSNCVANVFMIPGLEFKDDLCPMCQTRELTDKLKSVVPILHEIPYNKKSRFDVAYFIQVVKIQHICFTIYQK